MAKSHRFALDQERQARVERAGPRRLVLAEEPSLLLGISRGVEATADGHDVGKRRLEPLAGPSEGHRLFVRDLGVDPSVRFTQAGHRARAIASR